MQGNDKKRGCLPGADYSIGSCAYQMLRRLTRFGARGTEKNEKGEIRNHIRLKLHLARFYAFFKRFKLL